MQAAAGRTITSIVEIFSFGLTVDFPLRGKYNVGWTGNRSVILKKGARQIWKTAAEAADVIPAISVNLRNLYGSGLLFIGNTGLVLPLTVLKNEALHKIRGHRRIRSVLRRR